MSEAARCGDLDVATDFLRNALSERDAGAAASVDGVDLPPCEASGKGGSETSATRDAEKDAADAADAAAKLAALALAELEVPADALKAAELEAALKAAKSEAPAHGGYKPKNGSLSQDGWEIKCHVDLDKTCQSLRTLEYPRLSQKKKPFLGSFVQHSAN